MNDQELMQQALDALEDVFGKNKIDVGIINDLRSRLAQPKQEPVAWMTTDDDLINRGYNRFSKTKSNEWNIPVYAGNPPDTRSTERDYDVVIDALQKYRDTLWKMTERNMNSEYIGMNIMDDIRLRQIEELDEAIKERKSR